jgi:ABC-type uncharacterized transport system permease subunit
VTDDGNNIALSALAIVSALLYLAAAWRQLLHLERQLDQVQAATAGVGIAAVVAHLSVAVLSGYLGDLNLGFYRVASLIGLAMSAFSVILLLLRPLHTLTVVVFPLTAMAVLISTFAPATGRPLSGLEPGLLWHVSTSLMAIAVLSLASVQGAVAVLQGKLLKRHRTQGMVRLLPALDMSENMFFELMVAGFLLLGLAIIAGALFIDDMFAQSIVHKTILTAAGWLIYGWIIITHWRKGMRMSVAVNWAIGAWGLVMLGFFGSKLVTELLLG